MAYTAAPVKIGAAVVERPATPQQHPLDLPMPSPHLGGVVQYTSVLAIALVAVVLEHGYRPPLVQVLVLRLVELIMYAAWLPSVWLRLKVTGRFLRIEMILALVAVLGAVSEGLGFGPHAWHLFEWSLLVGLLGELCRLNLLLAQRLAWPALLLPLNLLGLIVVGTLLIKLPEAMAFTSDDAVMREPVGGRIRWLDASFTMTSAVCVTGLTVRDMTQFSPFGQTMIGLFMQLGGLYITVFGSMFILLWAKQWSRPVSPMLRAPVRTQPIQRIAFLVRTIVMLALVVELIGALVLMPMWAGPLTWLQRLAHSVFHSISAFCNAGLALEAEGLAPYRYASVTQMVVVPLLVAGGLGIPVLVDLGRAARGRAVRWLSRPRAGKPMLRRLNMHTRVVLVTTAALYLYGVLGLALAQLMPSVCHSMPLHGTGGSRPCAPLLDLSRVGTVLADASTMSLNGRTAGFPIVPSDQFEPASQFVLITLMMVGASPGGSGGGMKTTTLAIVLWAVWATLRKRYRAQACGGRITESLVLCAAMLVACIVALVCVATGLLCLSESMPFNTVLFEAVSAASTTGLSLGITGQLTCFGKGVIIATIFLGRIGPLLVVGWMWFGAVESRTSACSAGRVCLG